MEGLTASAGKLPSMVAIGIILGVLEGIEYLHRQKIIHRDIKPQNILVVGQPPKGQESGEPNTPKITDFGLAVCYGRAGGTRLTKVGTGMGTLMYMAPEQVKDAGNVREPADLYSVGIMLYYLLTGCSIFDYTTFFVMLYVFNCWDPSRAPVFQTGWFVESLMTQTIIIHVIRTNKIPFLQSRASWPLTVTTFSIMAFGMWLPYSPLAPSLGLTHLPGMYWPILI